MERIAELYGDLAQAHRALAEQVVAGLAVLGDVSLHGPMPKAPKLLTAAEVAELIGCHPRTLRRLELAGEIPPPIGEGKAKRWRRADLDKWGAL